MTRPSTRMGLFTTALVVVCAAIAHADDATGLRSTTPEERAAYQTSVLTDLLGLSKDQVTKVAAVNLEYARQLDPILKGDQSRFAKYRKADPILDAKDAAMKPLLSAAQYQKYLDSKKAVQDDLESHFAHHGKTAP